MLFQGKKKEGVFFIFYMADIWVIHEQVSDSIEAMEFQKSPKTCLQGTSIKYM